LECRLPLPLLLPRPPRSRNLGPCEDPQCVGGGDAHSLAPDGWLSYMRRPLLATKKARVRPPPVPRPRCVVATARSGALPRSPLLCLLRSILTCLYSAHDASAHRAAGSLRLPCLPSPSLHLSCSLYLTSLVTKPRSSLTHQLTSTTGFQTDLIRRPFSSPLQIKHPPRTSPTLPDPALRFRSVPGPKQPLRRLCFFLLHRFFSNRQVLLYLPNV
jgi:hypothetical protein